MKLTRLAFYGALVCVAGSCFGSAVTIGIEELYRLDRLPALKDSIKIGSVSSYDRTGGNDDGFSGKYSFVRKEAEGLVLADLKGPGVIYRVWTPTPTDDVLEFIFDGEAQPRVSVKYRELFLGSHPAFPKPLVGSGGGGYYCYVPMPFAKSCVVRIRAPKTQFYQINYALYAPDTPLATFSPDTAGSYLQQRQQAMDLFKHAGADISRFAAPPNDTVKSTTAKVVVPPKSTRTLFQASRGGRLVGLRLSPAEAMASKARDLLLQISFDGEAPAVCCPVGDFFGYAWGKPAVKSLLVGTSGATNYCYFPMPFERKAKIELVSERDTPVEIQAEIQFTTTPRAANEGKFYALWRRENPTRIGEPYTFLDTLGRGHLVGLVLQAQGQESGKTLFFEGDDETSIDGECVIRGTGSEDFFNGGWYDVPDRWDKQFSFPLSGCLGYAKHLGRTGAYRLFLGDAYAFRQSLRQTIEHSGEKNNILTDYSSVTYWYAAQHPAQALTPPPLKERAVRDPEEVIFPAWWQLPLAAWSFDRATLTRKKVKIGAEEVRSLSLSAKGDDWFGQHFLSPVVDIPAAGKYSIYLEAVKGPAQARVQMFQYDAPAGAEVDFYAEQSTRSGRVLMGKLDLSEGKNTLTFKLISKNDLSTALGLDLVEIVCVREK